MTVSSQIIEVLNDICNKFGVVIDWSADNIFPYLTELVNRIALFVIGKETVSVVICGIMIAIATIIIKYIIKNNQNMDLGEFSFCIFFVIVLYFIGFFWGYNAVVKIIQAKILPELVAFEYIKNIWNSGLLKF